jgi:hypothetical protein
MMPTYAAQLNSAKMIALLIMDLEFGFLIALDDYVHLKTLRWLLLPLIITPVALGIIVYKRNDRSRVRAAIDNYEGHIPKWLAKLIYYTLVIVIGLFLPALLWSLTSPS